MTDVKPIKRHEAIAEFSRDHHFALLLIWKLREGLKNSIENERMKQYAIHFFDTELQLHFKEEEELLFTHLPKENKLRIQAETEHRLIYQMIDDMRNKLSDHNSIQQFADTLERHIRFEERELFNYLQTNFSDATLSEIALSLKSREHESGTPWPDVFWEKR
jgi:hypothetical protein